MFETLYKTDSPQEFERAEYYQPQLVPELQQGRTIWFLREKHGWYDDQAKRPIHHISTLNPEQGSETYWEAEALYNKQLKHRAKEGFVHSFAFDPMSDPPVRYRRIPSD